MLLVATLLLIPFMVYLGGLAALSGWPESMFTRRREGPEVSNLSGSSLNAANYRLMNGPAAGKP